MTLSDAAACTVGAATCLRLRRTCAVCRARRSAPQDALFWPALFATWPFYVVRGLPTSCWTAGVRSLQLPGLSPRCRNACYAWIPPNLRCSTAALFFLLSVFGRCHFWTPAALFTNIFPDAAVRQFNTSGYRLRFTAATALPVRHAVPLAHAPLFRCWDST